MKFNEYLQFLIMLIPTLLLLAAAALTLAFPAGSTGEPVTVSQYLPESLEVSVPVADVEPVNTAPDR